MEAALVADFLSVHGFPLDGDGRLDELIVETARANHQGRPFYVVRDWLLLNIMVPSDVEDDLKAMGLQPTVVFANTVVYDSRTQGSRVGAMRSSFQRMRDGCIFESMHASFVLAGPGVRKHVSLPALLALENA